MRERKREGERERENELVQPNRPGLRVADGIKAEATVMQGVARASILIKFRGRSVIRQELIDKSTAVTIYNSFFMSRPTLLTCSVSERRDQVLVLRRVCQKLQVWPRSEIAHTHQVFTYSFSDSAHLYDQLF